jgi:thioredoxin reductase (NADPH)
MSNVEKCVIIGSGPAGWSAAIYAARANLQPLLFTGAETDENKTMGRFPMGQLAQTTEVENYAGFPAGRMKAFLESAITERQYMVDLEHDKHHAVTGPELMELMRQQAANFGTRIIADDVIGVDFSGQPLKLHTQDNGSIDCHTVIVATGASANYLGLPSEETFRNKGVSACAVCDGALHRFRDRPLVVVGGGDSAVEEASYLTKYASKVYMVLRRGEMRASKIMQDRAVSNPKIEFVKYSVVDEVLGNPDDFKIGVTAVRVKNVETGATTELEASGMFLAIGHTPNTKFLGGQVETHSNGYIRWTQPYRTITSVPGVFAAGDVADDYYRQAITSAGTGCMAALDAERYLGAEGIH